MPASVETLTKTHEFLRTNASTFVTLIWSFGPTAAASVRSAVNSASRPNSVPVARAPRSKRRRSICAGGMMDQPYPGRFYTIALDGNVEWFRPAGSYQCLDFANGSKVRHGALPFMNPYWPIRL